VSGTKIDGGVRRYLGHSWRDRLRGARWRRVLGACGGDVHFEPDVQFLRHPERVSIGSHVIVKEGARVCPTNPQASIAVGDWTTIGYHTFVFASLSISIGRDCLIAPFCYLVDANHGIARDRLIRDQPLSAEPIRIEDDVWLGVGAVVLKGVTIGQGAVIGAQAVVTADVPPYAIVAGNPAQVVGHRQ
jgi:acetyltransferase-like isoleucine patch superfamily enzyme